ncbi:MAG: ABC transporter permease [Xanthomonadales bacterium]|nr:ABC transporter permease [Xanthomonadales bacterium]
MWNRILTLMKKEFVTLLKDPKSRFVVIGPPIIQLIVFGYAASFDLKNVPFAVYDQDQSALSRTLVARFDGSPSFQLVRTLTHDAEVAPVIDATDALLVLRIHPNFERDVVRGDAGFVQVIVDGRNSNAALLALNYVRDIVTRFNEDLLERRGLRGPPATLEVRAWFNPNLEGQWYFVPGIIGLLITVVTILVTSLSVAREREQGTFDQLLVTPLRPIEILIGKALPGFVIGMLGASVVTAVAVFWFGVPMVGSLAVLFSGVAIYLLSTVGIGLMISSLAVTQQQGLLGAFLFLVPSIILSGFSTPIANMPGWVQTLTYANPLRYFIVVIRGVFLEGRGFDLVPGQFLPMAVIGLVAMTLAVWLFRRRMY